LVRSQEDERAWLSRELHDGTSQMLVSAKLLTESALDRLAPAENEVRPVLQRALARVSDAVDDVRNISHRLRPAELDTLGLTAALRELGDEMCVPAGIAFEWQEGEEEGELPDEIRTTLFRVSQEALTNVHKHARARRVRMALQTNAAGLRLRIDDDGQGFDSQAVAQHPRRGIGLRNMRERLMAIGGSLHIASRPGETSIVADVPVDAIARLRNAA
jgi:two-component system NarL family sensor kinase